MELKSDPTYFDCHKGGDVHCLHTRDDGSQYCCECKAIIHTVQTISYKDFILLEACKAQWPSHREKMEAAELLNELKE